MKKITEKSQRMLKTHTHTHILVLQKHCFFVCSECNKFTKVICSLATLISFFIFAVFGGSGGGGCDVVVVVVTHFTHSPMLWLLYIFVRCLKLIYVRTILYWIIRCTLQWNVFNRICLKKILAFCWFLFASRFFSVHFCCCYCYFLLGQMQQRNKIKTRQVVSRLWKFKSIRGRERAKEWWLLGDCYVVQVFKTKHWVLREFMWWESTEN